MALDGEKSVFNDKFTSMLADGDREILLKSPLPIIFDSLTQAANVTVDLETRQQMASKSLGLATTGKTAPDGVLAFVNNLVHLAIRRENLDSPYLNQTDSAYLSMFCGSIEALEESDISQAGRKRFVSRLREIATEKMKNNPDRQLGEQVIGILSSKIHAL